MAGEFDSIEVAEQSATINGQAVTVRPITIGRLPAFTRALRPIIPALSAVLDVDSQSDPQFLTEMLMEVFSEHGERLIDAVAVAVAPDLKNVPQWRADIEKIDPAEFILLALAVLKVNADFFARRLLPAITQAKGAAATIGAGQIPANP